MVSPLIIVSVASRHFIFYNTLSRSLSFTLNMIGAPFTPKQLGARVHLPSLFFTTKTAAEFFTPQLSLLSQPNWYRVYLPVSSFTTASGILPVPPTTVSFSNLAFLIYSATLGRAFVVGVRRTGALFLAAVGPITKASA